MPKRSFLNHLRPSRLMGALSVPEMVAQATADDELDLALQRLAEATRDNEVVCTKVRRRQSSGSLKLVSTPPPPDAHPAE